MWRDCEHGVSLVLAQYLNCLPEARFLSWLLLTQTVYHCIVLHGEKYAASLGHMDGDFNASLMIFDASETQDADQATSLHMF